jgi:hypothetical protein
MPLVTYKQIYQNHTMLKFGLIPLTVGPAFEAGVWNADVGGRASPGEGLIPGRGEIPGRVGGVMPGRYCGSCTGAGEIPGPGRIWFGGWNTGICGDGRPDWGNWK